jgi:hypothetical protein
MESAACVRLVSANSTRLLRHPPTARAWLPALAISTKRTVGFGLTCLYSVTNRPEVHGINKSFNPTISSTRSPAPFSMCSMMRHSDASWYSCNNSTNADPKTAWPVFKLFALDV